MSGKLYVIGTPIGNLEDITMRQLRLLREVDFIAAEDTRVTRKLLFHYQIHTPVVSYHEHSRLPVVQKIVERIAAGETCGIVTDAGMPCISDPGVPLIQLCYERQLPIEVVPGPSAVVSALAVAGLEFRQFTFVGFLPVRKRERMELLRTIQTEQRALVLYEAPHKLVQTLTDLVECLGGERMVAVCRELTKVHEQVLRLPLQEALAYFSMQQDPRGEFVLVLAPPPEQPKETTEASLEQAIEQVRALVEQGMRPRAACKQVAAAYGLRSNVLYQALTSDAAEDPDA